ncbi:hypothetical protein Tco_0056678 [Tanacetum coccineum]
MNVMAVHLDMFCPFMKNWIARHRDEHGSGTDGTGTESDGSENRIFQKSRNREPNQEQKNLKLKKRNRNRRFWFGSVLLGSGLVLGSDPVLSLIPSLAGVSRPGKNPLRAFLFNLSRATSRPGFVSRVALETTNLSLGKVVNVVV